MYRIQIVVCLIVICKLDVNIPVIVASCSVVEATDMVMVSPLGPFTTSTSCFSTLV